MYTYQGVCVIMRMRRATYQMVCTGEDSDHEVVRELDESDYYDYYLMSDESRIDVINYNVISLNCT
jgi:hypothetical protein